MADNFLEKRMEDLKSGRLSAAPRTSTAPRRKGCIQVEFPSRRVIVTGGANGIGLTVTKAFVKAGCKVAVFDRDRISGQRLAHDIGIRFYEVDLTGREEIEKAFDNLTEAWKDIDIIVSNAGIFISSPLADSDPDEFDSVMATNLRPTYILARKWARFRRTLPIANSFGGRLIAISSTRHIQSEGHTEAYSASKGGVAALSHSLMMSLSEFGITSNCISPGWIHTGDESQLSETDRMQHPSRRVGRPEDIASLCLFLSLPGNDFINGADIPVDGGMTRRMIYEP